MGRFVEVRRRRGLKVSTDNSKSIVLDGEDGLECEVCVDGMQFEHVSEINIWELFLTNQVHMK